MVLGALVITLLGCSVSGQPSPQSTVLTGVLTLRGAQIEAWWSLRTPDGRLWRLTTSDAAVRSQFQPLAQQAVRAEGVAQTEPGTEGDGLVLSVTRISLANKAN